MSPAAPAARGRPSWSGLLRVSLVAVPVKAYAAVAPAATHFNQLHADCGRRIRHQKCCPRHGPVDGAAVVSGYQYAPDRYVVVEADELDRLRPARDRALVLEQCVAVGAVDPAYFAGRTLYLVPDGPAARHPYAVVTAALRGAGRAALGRVVLSGCRRLVLVRPSGRLLAAHVLHYPAQVRAAAAWEAGLADTAAAPDELRLARRLIAAAGGPLDWSRYRDTTAEELARLVEAKVANRPAAAPTEETPEMPHLLEALKRSVAAAARERPGAAPAAAPPRRLRPRRGAGA